MIDTPSLFEHEEKIIAKGLSLLDHRTEAPTKEAYAGLLEQYRKLYRLSKRLVTMGDRMQTQLGRLNDRLAESEEKYRGIFEGSIQGIFRASSDMRFLDVNPAMAKIFNFESPEAMTREAEDIGRDIFFSEDQRKNFYKAILETGMLKDYPIKLRRGDGKEIWVEICAKALFDHSGNLVELEGLVNDVTERRCMLEELKLMARVDDLTGIWNRRYFLELGQREMARASRGEFDLSLIYFDIDHFKTINDTYGHHAGDMVLREVAMTGLGLLREIDVFGRMGGDEFAILLPGTTTSGAESVAERIRESFAGLDVCTSQKPISFSASFGVATHCPKNKELACLIKNADQALYESKRKGRNSVSSCRGPAK